MKTSIADKIAKKICIYNLQEGTQKEIDQVKKEFLRNIELMKHYCKSMNIKLTEL